MEGLARIMFDPVRDLCRRDDRRRIEQAAAVCLRDNPQGEGLEVLLVASSRTGQWGIPKGHIEPGEASHETARREAYEEAGVEGQVSLRSCGFFTYRKSIRPNEYRVAVHVLMVHGLCENYPEETSRLKKWVPLADAGRNVAHPGLAQLLDQIFQDQMEEVRVA